MFQIKTLDKHSAFCFFSKVLKTSRFFDTIYMYNYVKRGLGNENEKGDNADKQAQHNYARFPCQEYNRIFFKGVFRPFLYGWGTPFCVA